MVHQFLSSPQVLLFFFTAKDNSFRLLMTKNYGRDKAKAREKSAMKKPSWAEMKEEKWTEVFPRKDKVEGSLAAHWGWQNVWCRIRNNFLI